MGTRISFARPDGKPAGGYLAKAGRDHAPGIVVIQEWWGLSDQIKGMCDRLALAGYDALAPDLYGGVVVPYHDTAAAGREMDSLDFLDVCDQTVRGAVMYLKRNGVRAGLTGFCLGGAVTILGAARVPEVDAAVCFYGLPPDAAAKASTIKAPFQGHFASRDDWCTPALVASFTQALRAAGNTSEVFSYEADHAFMNEHRDAHDRAAAELAWQQMLAFWASHLS